MTKKLFLQAIAKFLAGVVLMGLLLFVPAGTMRFPNAWLLMGLLFIPMLIVGVLMMRFAPALLEKRLNAREKQSDQQELIRRSGEMFIAAFILAGLNFRFGWLSLPQWVVRAASAVFLLAYLMWGEVLRENAWLSRTVEVQQGQRVVDSGLYGVLRHPMYAASVLLFLSMPLILNSIFSFLAMLGYLPLIIARIQSEERLLKSELPGYEEYMERVRFRLIPFVW